MDKLKNVFKLFIVAAAFFVAPLLSAQEFTISDFSCGLSTDKDASLIGDGCASDIKNADVRTGSIESRLGSVKQNSSAIQAANGPIRFLHQFPDESGNFWLISVTSNSIYASSNGGVTNTLITSNYGTTSNSDFSAINAYGKVRLTDGTTNWILWDGTTVSVSTASPKSKISCFYNERVWAAVGSELFASAAFDPEDWTDDENTDDDAFSELIRQNDGYPIRACAEFKGDLYVFKDFSIDKFSTVDGLTYTRTPITNVVGTRQPKSIQVTPSELIFLGHDNYYTTNGVSVQPISDDIKLTVDAINQLLASEVSSALFGSADFAGGQSTYTSLSILDGAMLQDYAAGDDSVFGDNGATYDALAFSLPASFLEPIGEIALTGGTTFTISVDTTSSNHMYFADASVPGSLAARWNSDASNTFGERIYYISNPVSTGSWSTQFYGDLSSTVYFDSATVIKINTGTPNSFTSAGYSVDVKFHSSSSTFYLNRDGDVLIASRTLAVDFVGSGANLVTVNLVRTSAGAISARIYDGVGVDETLSGTDTTYSSFPYLSFAYNGSGFSGVSFALLGWSPPSVLGPTALYISEPFDLTNTNVKHAWLDPTYALSAGSVTYSVYFDSNTSMSTSTVSSFISSQTLSGTFTFTTPVARYLRYGALFNAIIADVNRANTSINAINITIISSTGTYLTPPVPLSGVSFWSSIGISDIPGDGTISYALYSDSDTVIDLSNASSYLASQSITNGQIATISTGAYARIGASFSINSATTTRPRLYSVTFNYGTGTGLPVTSVYYNSEYYSSVSISSPTINDSIIVWDKNKKWTVYDNWQAYSMSIYRQKPFIGRSLSADIWRVLVPGVYSDADSPFTSYWQSKEFNFGFPTTNKTMNRYYITGAYKQNQDVDFIYGVNRSTNTTTKSIDQDTTLGEWRNIIAPTSTSYSVGTSHRFKFLNDDVGESFKIYSVTTDPRKESQP